MYDHVRLGSQALIIVMVVALAQEATASIYSPIRDATSGQEPDLWQVLENTAPAFDWISTDYLNSGAGGRRVDDAQDQSWKGTSIEIWLLTEYWGGSAQPADSLGQQLVFDDRLLDGTNKAVPLPAIEDYGDYAALSLAGPQDTVIFGDESGRATAWTIPSLNTPFGDGITDRTVTFDVHGLDIYRWTGQGYEMVLADAEEGSYILAFDPGSDHDYQDMLVLVQGVSVPEPATLGLMVLGALTTLRRSRRR